MHRSRRARRSLRCLRGIQPRSIRRFVGNTYFTDSAANSPQTAQLTGIGKSPTTTSLTATPSTVALGQAVTLTAIVIPAYSGTPTGTVTFYDGTANLGTVALNLGTAQLIIPTLNGGSNSLTASYSGDAVFLTSVSAGGDSRGEASHANRWQSYQT